ncbi:MAG: 2-oxo acid dehydrogenase subunit E2 [Deltaproteobacteria bacterium]|nr:2-oxo acid dehydrogenase subunit E2 [Deltaproteobacteria bacterium]
MDVKLPQLAENVEGGVIVNILVKEGQEVKKDQPILELETQKAVGSIPAPASGVVSKIYVKEGMEVSVGQLLISIGNDGAAAAAPTQSATAPAQAPALSPMPAPAPPERRDHAPAAFDSYRHESKSGAAPPAAPSLRKLSRDLGIDLTRVRGSESGGRIVLEDIRAYIERLQQLAFQGGAPLQAPMAAPAAPVARPSEAPDFSKWGPVRREKMTALRRTVSQRMAESWTAIPKIDQFDDVDITDLLALRKKHAPAYEKKDARLTITTFLIKAIAAALKKHPKANASIDEAAQEIVLKDYCHIGVAVDTEAGLIVPVLRNVDQKNLLDISLELAQLSDKARQRKISLEELQGGTFTISNQGSIGGSHFTPIIYAPQVAILGVGQGSQKPVVVDGKIAIRTLLPLCLSYDHRVLDGADAVRFLKDILANLLSFSDADVKLK